MALIQFTRNHADHSTSQGFEPVAAKKFCTECGKEIQAGVKFCPEFAPKQG